MAESNNAPTTPETPKNQDPLSRVLVVIVAIIAAAFWFFKDPHRAANILQVLIGFGAVIFVHELGHFLAAKAVAIKVEAFSLGFGPVVLGVTRALGGFRVRILPTLIPGKNEHGALSFLIPWPRVQAGETEYRLSLIPLGGYVKMLGQEDVAADKPSDDPRAFVNKKIWQRAVVISAGVVMNVISAVIIFMIVFGIGVEMIPAVVGNVPYGSPAHQAGMQVGDEIIAIDGKTKNITFQNIILAAAFADAGEAVPMTVRHTDGSQEELHLAPLIDKEAGTKIFGIGSPHNLTIAKVKEEQVLEQMKLWNMAPGDQVVEINEKTVQSPADYHNRVFPAPGTNIPKSFKVTLAHKVGDPLTHYDITVPAALQPMGDAPGQIAGLSPRIKIDSVVPDRPADLAGIEVGDIIVRFGELDNPVVAAVQQYVRARDNQAIPLIVLRGDEEIALEVTPRTYPPQSLKEKLRYWLAAILRQPHDIAPVIGVILGCDLYNPIVLPAVLPEPVRTNEASADEAPALALPVPSSPIVPSSLIVSIDKQPVKDWIDIYNIVVANLGKTVEIACRPPQSEQNEIVSITIPDQATHAAGFMGLIDYGTLSDLPFDQLNFIVKGGSLAENLKIGLETTYSWIAQNYMFIKGMFTGKVSPSAASGPVGILKMSYTISSEKSLTFYCYFMAIISVALAVFNFLPLPVLDGGHIVMLIIEKIKGSPVSIKIQEIVTYIGLAIILLFALYVTFHDIIKVYDKKI